MSQSWFAVRIGFRQLYSAEQVSLQTSYTPHQQLETKPGTVYTSVQVCTLLIGGIADER